MRLLARSVAAFFVLFGLGILVVMVYLGVHQDSVEFLTAHRREMTIFAWVGSAVSLTRFATACLGTDWPGWWVEWPLAIGIGVLFYGSRDAVKDSTTLRKRPRLIKKTEGAVVMLYLLLLAGVQWYPMPSRRNAFEQRSGVTRIVFAGAVATLYVLEALFLSNRDLERDAGAVSATDEDG
jgi:hypothetical protein